MNPIRLLVLLAATLFAGPFHLGASWEWRIFDPNGKEVGYRIARVVDSVDRPEEHRVQWTIEVVDTVAALGPLTQILGESFDSVSGKLTSRLWQRLPSKGLLVPAGPFSSKAIEEHLEMMRPPSGGTGFSLREDTIPGYLNYSVGHFEGGSSYSLPPLDWNESAGWSHFRWLNAADYQFSNSEVLDWILVKKDGQNVTVPLQSFHLPRQGEVWIWERKEVRYSAVWNNMTSPTSPFEEKFESLQTVRIVIDSTGDDSHGAVRIHAQKTIVDSSLPPEMILVRWRSDLMPTFSHLDCDDLMDGFRSDWLDQPLGDSKFRYYGDFGSNTMLDSHGKSRFIHLRPNGGVDSLNCAEWGTRSGGWRPSETSTTVTYRLLSVNDSVIRAPAWTGVHSRMGAAKVPFDLREFAKEHPDALVKIVGADGRQHARMARDLFGSASGSLLRVGWFEVRLPDGSVQRGSFTR